MLGSAALALLALPPAFALLTNPDWRASPRFDGTAYRLSDADVVRQEVDPTGVAAVLATLERWRGGEADEAGVAAFLDERGFAYGLDELTALAAERGLTGRWVVADAVALANLRTPLVAHLDEGGGRLVIVRRVALDHVYVADPLHGQVLVPLASFLATWTGRAFAFPDPPPQPATW